MRRAARTLASMMLLLAACGARAGQKTIPGVSLPPAMTLAPAAPNAAVFAAVAQTAAPAPVPVPATELAPFSAVSVAAAGEARAAAEAPPASIPRRAVPSEFFDHARQRRRAEPEGVDARVPRKTARLARALVLQRHSLLEEDEAPNAAARRLDNHLKHLAARHPGLERLIASAQEDARRRAEARRRRELRSTLLLIAVLIAVPLLFSGVVFLLRH